MIEQAESRPLLLGRALRIEYATVGWNLLEGVAAVAVAVSAGSVALLGFGVDSFVESASSLVLIWRLRAEQRAKDAEAAERVERLASKLVAVSLFGLAAYIAFDAVRALARAERPEPTALGVAIAGISIPVMLWIGRAKRRVAAALGSRALEADAFQATTCSWLSLAALTGIALNAAMGWWWADPVAALAMTTLLVREGREAWRGDPCRC